MIHRGVASSPAVAGPIFLNWYCNCGFVGIIFITDPGLQLNLGCNFINLLFEVICVLFLGHITIVDSETTQGSDLGQNFFLNVDSLGAPRAERARLLLLEMNEEVKGEAVTRDVDTLISQEPAFFMKFSVVIATQLPEVTLLPLSRLLWSQKVPLVVARSYGFIG